MNKVTPLCRIACAVICVLSGTAAYAEESQFGYVYTTDLLPAGAKEIEQHATWRHQKDGGKFDLVEGRTEFEYGVSDRLQMSAYLNYAWTRASHDVGGETVPPETFAEVQVDPNSNWHDKKFVGVSVEGIYRLMSPYTDPFGLAIYFEPTIGNGLREMETRIIAQKNFFDDRLILAANITAEQEGRFLPADPAADPDSVEARGHWDHETDMNVGVAGSYRFAPNWSAGMEFQQEREYSSFSVQNKFRTNLANYLGPTIHYGGKHFFATMTFLEQLGGAVDYGNPDHDFIAHGRTFADDFEKYRVRVKLGYSF
ncbi:DUF6662 family protein [Aquirhabdus parva]|uniref:Uncharacterized protein n=1 Tax=Aquirhabdus parva TaxID=2283318 RepID=A0A345P8Z2_9GAMM|nr:DUF6662 family protein [Aquirhabdus parva]AXI03751.1 hypothetical protein HYN46_13455 [Aquirhabdus parva]